MSFFVLVSILVVMENALGAILSIQGIEKEGVSILVVMENALGEICEIPEHVEYDCLNPCCNGKCSWRLRFV